MNASRKVTRKPVGIALVASGPYLVDLPETRGTQIMLGYGLVDFPLDFVRAAVSSMFLYSDRIEIGQLSYEGVAA